MDESIQQNLEVTPVNDNVPAAVEPAATPAVDSAVAAAVEAYQPNYKFSVKDKEFEFDQEFKDLVKSKQVEDKLRDIYTKAYGLDSIKSERDTLKADYTRTKTEHESVLRGLETLNHFYEKNDLDNFFGSLKIPEQKIFEYALKKLEARELPKEHQAQYNMIPELQRQNYFLQQQMQDFTRQQTEMQTAQARAAYEQTLQTPEVNSFVKAFEEANGQGSFTQEVKMRGLSFHQQNGYDAPPEQIVKEILTRFNFNRATQPQAVTQTAAHNSQTAPVIPVAKGGNVSTVKKRVSSIADIEKEYQAL